MCIACDSGTYALEGSKACNLCAENYQHGMEYHRSLVSLIDASHPDNANTLQVKDLASIIPRILNDNDDDDNDDDVVVWTPMPDEHTFTSTNTN